MQNPFHFRARMDNLWRRANSNIPAYKRLNALGAIVRELYAPNDRARGNYAMLLATDPFDVARHKLRDLYDDREAPSVPLSPGRGLEVGSPGRSPPRKRLPAKTTTPCNRPPHLPVRLSTPARFFSFRGSPAPGPAVPAPLPPLPVPNADRKRAQGKTAIRYRSRWLAVNSLEPIHGPNL